MNLYVEPAPLQKVAGETPLDSSSDVWPEQVHQELIRQHPYLGTYTVTPVMTRTDGEQATLVKRIVLNADGRNPDGLLLDQRQRPELLLIT